MIRLRPVVIREWPIVGLLALFGILYSITVNSYGMFMWDEAEYASIGRSVLRGQGFAIAGKPNSLRPPLLPLAGAASMLLYGEQLDDSVLRVTNCVFALLGLLCVYGFAAVAFDRSTGLVAAALLGISPFFWTFVPFFLSEIPFLAFFAAAVWFFYFGAYLHQRFFLWSWICWALAFLTRYTASLFLPVIVLFVPMAWWMGGPDTRRRLSSRAFFLSPLAGLLLLLPWLIREYVTFGNPLAGVKEASRQLQVYLPSVSMPWHFYLRRMPGMLSIPIAVLFIAGVIWTIWKRDRFGLHTILTAAVILAWFSCYRYKEERMVSSALPFMAVIAAVALRKATASLRPLARGVALGAVLAGFFVVNLRATRPVFKQAHTLGYPSFLDAMAFLRSHASPGATVLGANFPQIHWYSDLRAMNIPEEKDLREALRHSEWVVITNFEPVQKAYVLGLVDLIAGAPSDSGAEFRDTQFVTIVVRSDRLLRALGE
jgi:4-amino-4-deoxy-L-arabinose transferase-like glycosyltransferase